MSYLTYNGKLIRSNGKYVSKMPEPIDNSFILFHVSLTGQQEISLRGNGEVSVDWGAGDVSTLSLLPDQYTVFNYDFTEERDVSISNPSSILEFSTFETGTMQMSSLDIPNSAISLEEIHIRLAPLSSFIIRPEWINLDHIELADMENLSSITIPSTLTLLTSINITDCDLSTFSIPSELNLIGRLDINGNPITESSDLDNILVTVNSFGTSDGYMDLRVLNMVQPTATGYAAKSSLQSRGWTVFTNEID